MPFSPKYTAFCSLFGLTNFFFDILLVFASFLQTYQNICFSHNFSFYFYLLQKNFYTYLLLALLIFFFHSHNNFFSLFNITSLIFYNKIFRWNCIDFINKYFKKFMDNIHVVKETILTVRKKLLVLVFLYLGSIYLQTRIKLKKSLKNILVFVNWKQCLRIGPCHL